MEQRTCAGQEVMSNILTNNYSMQMNRLAVNTTQLNRMKLSNKIVKQIEKIPRLPLFSGLAL